MEYLCPSCNKVSKTLEDYETGEIICLKCGCVILSRFNISLHTRVDDHYLFTPWLEEVDPKYSTLIRMICSELKLPEALWIKACRQVVQLKKSTRIRGVSPIRIALWAISKSGYTEEGNLVEIARKLGFNVVHIPKFEASSNENRMKKPILSRHERKLLHILRKNTRTITDLVLKRSPSSNMGGQTYADVKKENYSGGW